MLGAMLFSRHAALQCRMSVSRCRWYSLAENERQDREAVGENGEENGEEIVGEIGGEDETVEEAKEPAFRFGSAKAQAFMDRVISHQVENERQLGDAFVFTASDVTGALASLAQEAEEQGAEAFSTPLHSTLLAIVSQRAYANRAKFNSKTLTATLAAYAKLRPTFQPPNKALKALSVQTLAKRKQFLPEDYNSAKASFRALKFRVDSRLYEFEPEVS